MWQETWELPHMQIAAQILLRLALPTSLAPPAGVDPIHFNALGQARAAGYYDLLRIQDSLGLEDAELDLPEPWEKPMTPPPTD